MEAESTDGAVVRVVVVDDEPDVRFLVRRLLARHDRFEVVGEATDGRKAVEVAEELQPDVLLLDLMMPTSGSEALPHILSVSPGTMVVVFSGADPDTDARQRLLDLGAFNFYEKTRADRLAELLETDISRFRQALQGIDTVVPWLAASTSRPS